MGWAGSRGSLSGPAWTSLLGRTQQWGCTGKEPVRVRVAETVPPLAVQRNWMRSWQPPRSLR